MFPYNNNTVDNNKLYTKEKDSDIFKKFINILMIDGKKSKAFTILWDALVYAKNILQQQSAVIKNVEYSTKSPFYLERIKTRNLVDTKTKQNTMPLVNVVDQSITSKVSYSVKNSSISMIPSHHFVMDPSSIASYREAMAVSRCDKATSSLKNKYTQPLNLLLKSSQSSGLLYIAIENVTPSLEVRNVRIGGRTYQVPAIIPKSRQQTIAFRWIIDSAKKRKKKTKNSFSECLALELVDAYKKQGYAYQKRDELHKIAESNRAYLRYRWW